MQLFKLDSQGGFTEKPNTGGTDKDSTAKTAKNSLENSTTFGYKCVCLNARSIVNKRNELNIMAEDNDPHIIGITEYWATPDISDAELGMTGYVMFRKDRIGRRGGGVILYIKESIQAYEIKLEKQAECEEAVWCNIVTGNSTLTVGLVYRSPNISTDENEKIQNAIKEVSKRDCIIMGDFSHGRIQWKSQQSTGSEDQRFLNLVQDSFLTQHVLEPTRGENVLDIVLSSQKEFINNVRICEPLGCSDHNQIYFIIKVKGEQNRKILYRKQFHKGRYKDMRKHLAKIDWNNTPYICRTYMLSMRVAEVWVIRVGLRGIVQCQKWGQARCWPPRSSPSSYQQCSTRLCETWGMASTYSPDRALTYSTSHSSERRPSLLGY